MTETWINVFENRRSGRQWLASGRVIQSRQEASAKASFVTSTIPSIRWLYLIRVRLKTTKTT